MLGHGTYKVKHKQLNTEYRLIMHKGKYKLTDLNNNFIKYLQEGVVREFYDIIEKLPARDKNWNIVYYVNGSIRETINVNASYGVVRKKIGDMKRISHKIGLLVAVPVK